MSRDWLLAGTRRSRARSLRAMAVLVALTLNSVPNVGAGHAWLSHGQRGLPSGEAHASPTRSSIEIGQRRTIWAAIWAAGLLPLTPMPANALVKGVKPPEGYSAYEGSGNKEANDCSNVQMCKDIGMKREIEKYGVGEQNMKFSVTPSGTRYKDITVGSASAGVAEKGSTVQLRYRVMRSGKRSADGLSGEASTIFSLGFGEDDGPKDAVLKTKLGAGLLVKALDDGLIGMAVGGLRRIQVRPDYGLGWKKSGKCAEEVMAIGTLAGVPGSGAENEETCLDESKLPKPKDFGEKRRFARRFDESLIVEVELAGLSP